MNGDVAGRNDGGYCSQPIPSAQTARRSEKGKAGSNGTKWGRRVVSGWWTGLWHETPGGVLVKEMEIEIEIGEGDTEMWEDKGL
jgi:hypothetical protein